MIGGRYGHSFMQPNTSFLSMRLAIVLLVFALMIGVAGFMYFEEYNLREAFYMAIITISTVGFQEVEPLSGPGQIFTSILILLNLLVLSYILSAFTYYVVEGKIFKQFYERRMDKHIKNMKDHVIVCGYGKYGKEIISHLKKQNIESLIIEIDEQEIKQMENDQPDLLHIKADATQDDTLENAGIKNAKAIIAALPEDAENLFIVLSARQINPELVIISRAKEHRSEKKLLMAGANHVILPEQIGSFYMATLVSKPSATEFFSFISDELQHDIGFAEMSYDKVSEDFRDKSIQDMSIRKSSGANIIGFKNMEGDYIVNPKPDTVLEEGTSFILVGNTEQLERLQDLLKTDLDI